MPERDAREEDAQITIGALEDLLESFGTISRDWSQPGSSASSYSLLVGNVVSRADIPLGDSPKQPSYLLAQAFYSFFLAINNIEGIRNLSLESGVPIMPSAPATVWSCYYEERFPSEWRVPAARNTLGELLTTFGDAFLAIDTAHSKDNGLAELLNFANATITPGTGAAFAQSIYRVLVYRLDVERLVKVQRQSGIRSNLPPEALRFPLQVLTKLAGGERDYLAACRFFDGWRQAVEETGYQRRLRDLARTLYNATGHEFSPEEWNRLVEQNRALAPRGAHGILTRRLAPDLSRKGEG